MFSWPVVILLLVTICSSQDQEYAESQGDVTVVGLFEIQSLTPDGACGSYIASSVQMLESVKWVFKKLNEADYIPGVKLGKFHGKVP